VKLTQKLLNYIHRVFDKDPGQFLAFRLRYAGTGMTWVVADGVLTITVSGGSGVGAIIDLSQYTLSSLVSHLSGMTGYSVTALDATNSGLSALVLLDGSGDQSVQGGDGLYGYTSLLFSYMESVSAELSVAGAQVVQALRQISTYDDTGVIGASGYWLNEIASYYGTVKYAGETDEQFSPRAVGEVLRPKANNVAIEMAIKSVLGVDAIVTDYTMFGFVVNKFDGTHVFDGSINFDSTGTLFYGLFDIQYSGPTVVFLTDDNDDVLTSDNGYPLAIDDSITPPLIYALVEKLRDAGTHIHTVTPL